VLVALVSFTTISWIVPASNYAFRVSLAGHDVPRGINELTTLELRERLASDVDEPVRVFGARGDRRYMATMYHARVAVSCAAVVLSLLALPLLTWRRMLRLALGMVVCVCYVGYFFWVTDDAARGRLEALSPAAVAWLPNYLIAVIAITWMTLSSRVRRAAA
jgi:lipopolysaccharide export LptBFGC system permease protein LptF